ncbi:MAG: hypothetical protein AAFY65_12880 [Pseudomonadota bacterium]
MKHLRSAQPLTYEYEVIPAPHKPERRPGLKTDAERMAFAMALIINQMADDDWEYIRCDTLPVDNTTSITGTESKSQTLLVFRRPFVLAQPPKRDAPLVLNDRL